jgi:hypothetical protein
MTTWNLGGLGTNFLVFFWGIGWMDLGVNDGAGLFVLGFCAATGFFFHFSILSGPNGGRGSARLVSWRGLILRGGSRDWRVMEDKRRGDARRNTVVPLYLRTEQSNVEEEDDRCMAAVPSYCLWPKPGVGTPAEDLFIRTTTSTFLPNETVAACDGWHSAVPGMVGDAGLVTGDWRRISLPNNPVTKKMSPWL